jgi:tetratricopeptide (TPR) repeat protein
MKSSSLVRPSLQKFLGRAFLLSASCLILALTHAPHVQAQQQEDPFETLRKRREELSRRAIEEPQRRQVEEGKLVGRPSSASDGRPSVSAKPGVVRVVSPEEKKALAHMERGLSFFSKKQFERAIQEYTEAIHIFPDMPALHNNLGSAQFALGSYDAAVASFKQACQLQPEYAQAHFNLGLAYLKQGSETDAAEAFNRAASAYLVAGETHLEAGRLDEAEEAFTQVNRIDPGFYLPYLKLSMVYEASRRYPEAIKAADESLRLQPKATLARFILGRIYLALNQRDKALEQYQKLKDAGDADNSRNLQRLIDASNATPK